MGLSSLWSSAKSFMQPVLDAGADFWEGMTGIKQAGEQSEADRQWQKDFAQNSIKWKVKDGQKVGLSPLASIGAQGTYYQPTGIGVNTSGAAMDGIKSLGQQIAHKFQRRDPENDLRLDNINANNKYIKAQTRKINLENARLEKNLLGMGANSNQAGIVSSGGIKEVPSERVASGRLGLEKAVKPMQKITVDKKGRIYFPLGKAAEEAMENDWFAKIKYLGQRVVDYISSVGRGASDRVVPNWQYRRDLFEMKKHIAKELGLSTDDIGYIPQANQYYIKSKARKKLSK